MTSAKKDLLKGIIIAEQMKKELEKRRKSIIKGKLKYLLEENSRDKDCNLTASEIDELIKEIHRLKIKDCFVQEEGIIKKGMKVEKSIITIINMGEYILFNESNEDGTNKMCMLESEFVKDKIGDKMPSKSLNVDELFEEKKYTLAEFLKDTTKPAVPGILPVEMAQAKRPMVICADGFSLSIQASNGHYCEPCANARTDYKKLELGKISQRIDELDRYMDPGSDDTGYDKAVFGYVPRELVEKILDAHGGIDKERTFGRDEVIR